MDELWQTFVTLGVAARARELPMVMPKFGDWYAPASRLVAAGAAAVAGALVEAYERAQVDIRMLPIPEPYYTRAAQIGLVDNRAVVGVSEDGGGGFND